MTALEPDELVTLLRELRDELSHAVDELDRVREAHRRVESLLLAVLEHVPVPVVVVDEELRIRAAGAAAESAWGAGLDRPLSAVEAVADLSDVCRPALESGQLDQRAVPDGFGVALLSEPGTGNRYAAIWADPSNWV